MIRKYLYNILPVSLQRSFSAKKLARTSKRLDLCAAQFSNILNLAKINSIEKKNCLEIGSGWVLSHALICYLLGAERIIATDIKPLAVPSSLKYAIDLAEKSIIRDLLAPFSTHYQVRKKLENIQAFNRFSFDNLKKLNIQYSAPIDLSIKKLNSTDFIYSFSVLEHVPKKVVFSLLTNLVSILNPGGKMIHCIHLEDHKNFTNDPFAFLSEKDSDFDIVTQNERGNRIRSSQWIEFFKKLDNTNFDILFRWQRKDKKLPRKIDHSISYIDENDLRTSHLGVCITKK